MGEKTAALAALIVIVVTGCGSSETASSRSAMSSAVATTTTTTLSPKQAIEGWRQENGQLFTNLGDSFKTLGAAMKTGEIAPVRTACDGMNETLNPLSYALPTPDVGLTTALQGTIDGIKAALRQCGEFDSSSRAADVREFSATMNQAMQQFDIASAILKDARGY